MDPINVGVIGCGYWGPNLIRNFNSLSDSRVSLICDADEKRLAHIQSLYADARVTSDFRDIVENKEINAVAIATAVRHHYAMAKASLEAGKHPLIEKPMASSVAQCEELNRISQKVSRVLFVGHTFIYSPPVRQIKDTHPADGRSHRRSRRHHECSYLQ